MLQSIKETIKNNISFLLPTFIVWIAMIVCLLAYNKVDLHLLVSGYRIPMFDTLMPYYTEIGGFMPWIVVFGLLFYRFGCALFVFATQVLTSLVVQPLKHALDIDRPKRLFQQLEMALPQVEGMKLHTGHSFPSGHSTAVFALFLSLAIIVKNPVLKFLFFVLAFFGAYSRVYLSQHFVEDTFAGSLIAVVVTLCYCHYHQKMNYPWMKKSFLEFRV